MSTFKLQASTQGLKTCRNLSPSGFILGLQNKCYLLNLTANSCQHIEQVF